MTIVAATPRRHRRPHVKVRQARQAQAEQNQRLTDPITRAGAALAAG